VIAKIVRGSGFRGALNYALNLGEKAIEGKEAELIGGNMCGATPKELAAEFRKCQKLRPEIAKPVWTESLRAAEGEVLSKHQWGEVAISHMRAIGLDPDTHMHTIVQHPQDNHIHIIASRIDIDGGLYLGRNENLIASKDCRRIEREYGLQPLQEKPIRGNKHLSKNEIEMKNRTGEPPPREKLQGIIKGSLADRPTQTVFEKRLVGAGVSFKKSTGGYSYQIDGVAFKGSQLGKDYKQSAVQGRISPPIIAVTVPFEQQTAATEKAAADKLWFAEARAKAEIYNAALAARARLAAEQSTPASVVAQVQSIIVPPLPAARTATAPQARQARQEAVVAATPTQSEVLPPLTDENTPPSSKPAVQPLSVAPTAQVETPAPARVETPTAEPPFPFSEMGAVERGDFSRFMKKMEDFGYTVLENLVKLCRIAEQMKRYINNRLLSEEKFHDLTGNQESEIQRILNGMPGFKVLLDYSQGKPAIELVAPRGQKVIVPEIAPSHFVLPKPEKTAQVLTTKKTI